jgi:hypothetical protein
MARFCCSVTPDAAQSSVPSKKAFELTKWFDFIADRKTAQQIGLTIPQWTLMKADRVIR